MKVHRLLVAILFVQKGGCTGAAPWAIPFKRENSPCQEASTPCYHLSATPGVRLDLSGRVNVHLVGPMTTTTATTLQHEDGTVMIKPNAPPHRSEQQPLFEVENDNASVFLGAKYNFRRRWWGVTHVVPTVRLYGRKRLFHVDLVREQSVSPRSFLSTTSAKLLLRKTRCALQWKLYGSKQTTLMMSIPVAKKIRYECHWTQSRVASTRKHAAAGWDIRINAQGQLEATHQVDVWRNLRATASIRRSWLSDDAVTKAVVKIQSMGEQSRTGVTVSLANLENPLGSLQLSIRQDFEVGSGSIETDSKQP